MQKYYQNEPRINEVYFRDYLSINIMDGAYVINLDKYTAVASNWIAFYISNNVVNYFDRFGVEHIPKETRKFIGNKNIKAKIFRIQVMCE